MKLYPTLSGSLRMSEHDCPAGSLPPFSIHTQISFPTSNISQSTLVLFQNAPIPSGNDMEMLTVYAMFDCFM